MTREVIAFVDWGRWVGDCATPGCGNARMLRPGTDGVFDCDAPSVPGGEPLREGVCDQAYPIRWPDDPGAVMAALADRQPAQRSWRPDVEEVSGDAAEQA